MIQSLCFLSARNLGDAVIHADFLKSLVAANYADRYIVWTFPHAAFLFEDIDHCEIVVSDFPMGATIRSFLRGGFLSFLSSAWRIRRARVSETLELVSDIRERWACNLLGAGRNVSPEWETGHPFRQHSRMARFRPGGLITIPVSVPNLYAAHAIVLAALLGSDRVQARLVPAWPVSPLVDPRTWRVRIGIHPFASAACKLWSQGHWIALIGALHTHFPQAQFVLFGAPSDRDKLDALVARLGHAADVLTTSLREFKGHMRDIDLLLGLDSFSVHMAQSQGVPAMVLVGPNDPRVFTPPGARSVAHAGRCVHQPCGGKPRCVGTDFQYVCMNAISPDQVMGEMLAASVLPIVPANPNH